MDTSNKTPLPPLYPPSPPSHLLPTANRLMGSQHTLANHKTSINFPSRLSNEATTRFLTAYQHAIINLSAVLCLKDGNVNAFCESSVAFIHIEKLGGMIELNKMHFDGVTGGNSRSSLSSTQYSEWRNRC
jgi:hypothetical protein